MLFKGYYNCLHRNGDGSYSKLNVPCEVISQTEKSYTIKLLAPNVNGHRWGDVIRVQKRMVDPEPEPIDCTNEWWND